MPRQLRPRAAQHRQDGQTTCTASRVFLIPAELLTPSTKITAPLLKLPPEILIQIFTYTTPADAIILALSCKQLLSIASLCNLQVPQSPNHRQPWALAATPGAHALTSPVSESPVASSLCSCGQLGSILPRLRPRDAQSHVSRSWNLCVDCVSYRPTRKAYWLRKLGRIDTQDWGKDHGDIWQSAVRWFAAGVKVQCPTCMIAEYDLNSKVEEMEELSPSF